jgi:glycosyltransferase involved in cell wall biosynthesis
MTYKATDGKDSHSNLEVQIVNTYPIGTGIGEYVSDLMKIGDFDCYSLIFKKSAAKSFTYPGTNFYSFIPGFSSKVEFLLNAYFQGIMYPKAQKIIKHKSGKGNIIHYSDPSVRPFINSKACTVTIHDILAYYPDKTNGGFMNARYRYIVKNFLLYKSFRNVIAISNKTREELLDKGWDNNIVVIPYAISDSFKFINNKLQARAILGLPADKFLILSISTNTPRKNLLAIKNTMDVLDERFALVRVGPSVGNSITFDYIDNREKMNLLYNACDVLLFPTLDEGFGRPVIEAMAAGLPTVVSDIKIMREIGGIAPFFSENSSESYKEGILTVLSDVENYRQKGINQASNFSFEMFKKRMTSFYSKLSK